MPINPLIDDNSNDPNKAVAANTNVGTTGTGGGATPQSTSVGTGGASTPQQKGTSSGSFTNLNQYVAANQDQAAGLGSKIEQGVQGQAAQGLQGLSQAQQQFTQANQAVGVNPNNFTEQAVTNTAQKAIENPSNVQQSDINAFNAVRSKNTALQAGSDTAPKDLSQLSSYQNAQNQLSTAQQNAGLTGSESGRATLLQGGTYQAAPPVGSAAGTAGTNVKVTGGFQRPDYNTGQVNLDQMLTQNAPSNISRLNNLRQQLLGQYGLASQENQAIQQAAQSRNQVVQDTAQANQNITNVLNGASAGSTAPQGAQHGVLTNYYNQLLNAPTQQNQAQQANLTQAQQSVKNYLITQYGSQPFGANVDDLVKAIISPATGVGSANVANTMTPQQLQSLEALNKLSGLTNTNIDQLGTGANAQVINSASIGQNAFNPTINKNWDAGKQILQGQMNKYSADISSSANNSINQQYKAYGNNFGSLDQAARYAVNKVNVNMGNPQYDAQQNLALYNSIMDQVSKIDQIRSTYSGNTMSGLNTGGNLPPSYLDSARSEVIQNMKNNWLSGLAPAARNSQNQAYWDNFWNQRFSPQVSGKWTPAIEAAARVQGAANLMNDVKSNPFIFTGANNLSNFGVNQGNSVNLNPTPGAYTKDQSIALSQGAMDLAAQNANARNDPNSPLYVGPNTGPVDVSNAIPYTPVTSPVQYTTDANGNQIRATGPGPQIRPRG